MNRIPRDRVYFHYNYFNNAAMATRDASGKAQISLSGDPRPADRQPRVASSLTDLIAIVRQSGLSPGFSGTFYIQDARHQTAGVQVHGWDYISKKMDTSQNEPVGVSPVPSQIRVLVSGTSPPGGATRLSASAPEPVRSVQDALIGAGFNLASFESAQ